MGAISHHGVTFRLRRTAVAVLACCTVAAAQVAVPKDRADAAVKLVSANYKPRPPQLNTPEAAKLIPRNGSWSVRRPHVDEIARACDPEGALCYAVLYRAEDAAGEEEVCEWTVAFGPEENAQPRVVAQNALTSATMLRVFNVGDREMPGADDPPHLSYPSMARAAHVSGTLVMQLVADGAGKVIDVQIASGPEPLRQGVAEDIKAWRLRPFVLNGKPVPYAQVFVVNFTSLGMGSVPGFDKGYDKRYAPCRQGGMIAC